MRLVDVFTSAAVGFVVYAILFAISAVGRINRKDDDDVMG